MSYSVYEIISPDDRIVYVGMATALKFRIQTHVSNAKSHSGPLYVVMRSFGRDLFRYAKVADFYKKEDAAAAEVARIRQRFSEGEPLVNRAGLEARRAKELDRG